MLDPEHMDAFFNGRIEGVGRIKCRMNYRHFFELARYLPTAHAWINTDAETWAAPALFLAWDRRLMAEGRALSAANLPAWSKSEEDHKLLGLDWDDFDTLVAPIAAQYVAAGGLARLAKIVHVPGAPTLGKAPGTTPAVTPTDLDDLRWLTEAASAGAVERRFRKRLAQKRDQIIAAKLKALYLHTCMACEVQLLVELSPMRHYAEAAHIRPLGRPHDGPDVPSNMIVLCPNHHLQFDRGVLSVGVRGTAPTFVSRIPGDPINRKAIPLRKADLAERPQAALLDPICFTTSCR